MNNQVPITEEDIIIKPSTELIADEYEHGLLKSTKKFNFEVHTFASKDMKNQQNVNLFIKTLENYSYEIKPDNIHCLEKENTFEVLRQICSDDTLFPGGIILYFSGYCREKENTSPREGAIDVFNGVEEVTINIQDVWTTLNVSKLQTKPKIFIFHVTSLTKTEIDSKARISTYNLEHYGIPPEADALIVYHKTDPLYQTKFTEQLCDNINNYGKTQDIISLVTCIDTGVLRLRPIIISTLTKKFYFTPSNEEDFYLRSHHLDIDLHYRQFKKHLKEVEEKLSQVDVSNEKKKPPDGKDFADGNEHLGKGSQKNRRQENWVNNTTRTNNNINTKRYTNSLNFKRNSHEMPIVSNQNKNFRRKSKPVLMEVRPPWRY